MSPGPPVLELRDPLARSELPTLYVRACRQLQTHPDQVLDVEVAGLPADAVAIDAIAHLALAARRHGCQVRLRGADSALCQLLELSGLRDVVCQ